MCRPGGGRPAPSTEATADECAYRVVYSVVSRGGGSAQEGRGGGAVPRGLVWVYLRLLLLLIYCNFGIIIDRLYNCSSDYAALPTPMLYRPPVVPLLGDVRVATRHVPFRCHIVFRN